MVSQTKECRVKLSVCSRANPSTDWLCGLGLFPLGDFQGLLGWAGVFLLAMVPISLSTIRINWN